jgi:DNA-binding transcriptional ArsR family regulator
LFPILALYTAGYLTLMIADFVLKEAFTLPAGMMPIYIALVGAYAADNEIRRWAGNQEPSRKGSLFVYLWLLFFLLAFTIRSFRPEYPVPEELSAVILQVLGIFFGSHASKYVYQNRTAAPTDLTEVVLALIREQGWCSRKQIEEKLGISERSANRLLAAIEAKGLIRREGEGKGVRYFLATPDRS